MQRDEALAVLRAHREEVFRRFPVKRLALFGSTVRNEADENSDVDVLVEFNGPTTFDGYFDLKFYLEEVLQREVDLVCANAVRPRIKPHIEREALDVT